MVETIGDLLKAAADSGQLRFSPEVDRMVDDLFARNAQPMSVETRQRLIAATQRALKERRDRIMGWRIALFTIRQWIGHKDEWHAYFTCYTHGTDISAPWVGPYELGREVADHAR